MVKASFKVGEFVGDSSTKQVLLRTVDDLCKNEAVSIEDLVNGFSKFLLIFQKVFFFI